MRCTRADNSLSNPVVHTAHARCERWGPCLGGERGGEGASEGGKHRMRTGEVGGSADDARNDGEELCHVQK